MSLCVSSFFFSSRRRHTRCLSDWSSDVCSSDLVRARIAAPAENRSPVAVRLRVRVYDERDQLRDVDGAPVTLEPGAETVLEWRLPRSEERRVGKGCGARWAQDAWKQARAHGTGG